MAIACSQYRPHHTTNTQHINIQKRDKRRANHGFLQMCCCKDNTCAECCKHSVPKFSRPVYPAVLLHHPSSQNTLRTLSDISYRPVNEKGKLIKIFLAQARNSGNHQTTTVAMAYISPGSQNSCRRRHKPKQVSTTRNPRSNPSANMAHKNSFYHDLVQTC